MYIGYLRVSTDRQDLSKQKHLILEYAHQHKIVIDKFIEVEISSTKSIYERKIEELYSLLNDGDNLVCAELSRISRNLLESLTIINHLSEKGVKIIFIRQPELSTNAPHTKLLLAIYSYFAEAERHFIALRVRQGLAKAKADGKVLGRVNGSRNKAPLKKLEPFRRELIKYFQMELPLTSIHKIIDTKLSDIGQSVSYHSLRYYILKDDELSSYLT